MKKKIKKVTTFIKVLKIFVFGILLLMSMFAYYFMNNFYLGNDLLLAAAVYILLSKMDRM